MRWGLAGSSWTARLRNLEPLHRRVLSREVIMIETCSEEITPAVGWANAGREQRLVLLTKVGVSLPSAWTRGPLF